MSGQSAALARHTNNIIVGSGSLFIDLLDAGGDLTGERYVGDAVAATLNVQSDVTTIYAGDSATAVVLTEFARSINRTLSMTLHDISVDNLALFVAGDVGASPAVAAVAVVDEKITVLQDRWYQVGQAADKPQGVVAVSDAANSFTVSDASGGGNAHTAGMDYVVDHASGRIYIVPGGGIADAGAEAIYVDYTPVAAVAGAKETVSGNRAATFEAAIRYIETANADLPGAARGRNFYARKCAVTASGDFALKSRDTEQQLVLSASILEPGGSAVALYIDGAAA